MSVAPLDYLFTRRSIKIVQAPGPNEADLALILQAAMSAPDHGRLQPWRFTLIREAGIARLADLSTDAIRAANLPFTPEKEASVRRWLGRVPLLIAIACKLDHSNTKIPEHERMLSVGAAVMNMLNAAHMLGYGAFWSTGLGTYTDDIPEILGFDSLDYRFMGFLSIGTPVKDMGAAERPDFQQFVTEWTGG
ncbi:nitroreductase [Alcaligenaceae bacterium]|nr:nitroreductase [Alcaligenaceae bacterium]